MQENKNSRLLDILTVGLMLVANFFLLIMAIMQGSAEGYFFFCVHYVFGPVMILAIMILHYNKEKDKNEESRENFRKLQDMLNSKHVLAFILLWPICFAIPILRNKKD